MVGKKSAKGRRFVLSVDLRFGNPVNAGDVAPIGVKIMHKVALFAAVAVLALTAPAGATVFSGTFTNTNPPAAPGGRCAALTVTIGNFGPFYATGTSNFGAFSGAQSHCLNSGPPIAVGAAAVPYFGGLFTYTFAHGTLSGTYDGLLTNDGATGVIDNVQKFVVTGGTGSFAGATGSFTGTGGITFASGPPAATLTIAGGSVIVPGVPEPSTWGLLIIGFGITGALMRRNRVVAAGAGAFTPSR